MSADSAIPQPAPVLTLQQIGDLFRQHMATLVQSLQSEVRCHADIDAIISDAYTSLIRKPPSDLKSSEAFLLKVVARRKVDFFRAKKQRNEFLKGAAPLGSDGIGDVPCDDADDLLELLQQRELGAAADIRETPIYKTVFARSKERDRIVLEWIVIRPQHERKKDIAARLQVQPSQITESINNLKRTYREVWHEQYEERFPINERVHGNKGKKRERKP